MNRYLVKIINTDYAEVEVVARTKKDAEEKVESMYVDGRIEWSNSDVEIEVVEEGI